MQRYTIVLDTTEKIDPRQIAKDFAEVFNLTVLEAKIKIRKARGVLVEYIPEEKAKKLSEVLASNGINHRLIQYDLLPKSEIIQKVSYIEHSNESFIFKRANTDLQEAVSWDQIVLVSAGLVAQPGFAQELIGISFESVPSLFKMDQQDARIVRQSLLQKLGKEPDAPVQKAQKKGKEMDIFDRLIYEYKDKARLYVDLIIRESLQWLRVINEECVYKYKDVKMSAALMCKYLLNDLVGNCKQEALTDMTLKFLSMADPKTVMVADLEQFNHYTIWSYSRLIPRDQKCKESLSQ